MQKVEDNLSLDEAIVIGRSEMKGWETFSSEMKDRRDMKCLNVTLRH